MDALKNPYDRIHEILWKGRTSTDPGDEFSPLTPALSEERLQVLRSVFVELYGEDMKSKSFTCDDCGLRATCPLVFDLYNTEGDCLMDK